MSGAAQSRGIKSPPTLFCSGGIENKEPVTLQDGTKVFVTIDFPDTPRLEEMNALIARSIESWTVTDRVKRAIASNYRYAAIDLTEFTVLTVRDAGDPKAAHTVSSRKLLGVATLGRAMAADGVEGENTRLLHGIFVDPDYFRSGVGPLLLAKTEDVAREVGATALIVRAFRDAQSFFARHGYAPHPAASYAHAMIKLFR